MIGSIIVWNSLNKVSEQKIHVVRWVLVICWIILIVSLFYDPLSSYLTAPDTKWSPLRIAPGCVVFVQGECLKDQPL